MGSATWGRLPTPGWRGWRAPAADSGKCSPSARPVTADSPYQSFSAFAGNPMLISPDLLVQDGLLRSDELEGAPAFPMDSVDFGAVIAWKDRSAHAPDGYVRRPRQARAAWRNTPSSERQTAPGWRTSLCSWRSSAHTAARSWTQWPEGLRARNPEALAASRRSMKAEIEAQSIRQSVFFRQWSSLAEAAHASGVDLVGRRPDLRGTRQRGRVAPA